MNAIELRDCSGGLIVGNTVRSVSHWGLVLQFCTGPVRVVGSHGKVFDPEGMVVG
jgi:hypothetical protein